MADLSFDEQATPARLSLGGNLTIYEVSETHAALLDLLGSHPLSRLQLDLGAVDELDSAGVQLLLALQRQIQRGGGVLEVTAASASATELLELLRLRALYPTVWPATT